MKGLGVGEAARWYKSERRARWDLSGGGGEGGTDIQGYLSNSKEWGSVKGSLLLQNLIKEQNGFFEAQFLYHKQIPTGTC